MTELYTPPPAYATIEHLRPERTLADQTRTLLTWLSKNEIDAWSLSISEAATVVTLRAVDGPEAAVGIVAARDALPGGRMSIADRIGGGLVIRADGDVPNHGPIRVLAYVERRVGDLILQAEDTVVTTDGAEQPVDPRSVRVAAGLTALATAAGADTAADDPADAPAEEDPAPADDAPQAADATVPVPSPRPAADDTPAGGDDQ